MSKKRKAESDQSSTLLDFFSTARDSSSPSTKKQYSGKKQKTGSRDAGFPSSTPRTKDRVGTNGQKSLVIPKDVEIINLIDSDEEDALQVTERLVPEPLAISETAVPAEGGRADHMVPIKDPCQTLVTPEELPEIDGSAFFMDSPDAKAIVEEHDEPLADKTTNLPRRRNSNEWESGDDEGVDEEDAGTETGASDYDDEMPAEVPSFGLGHDEEDPDTKEEIEVDASDMQIIELSDDDDEPPKASTNKGRQTCPVCDASLSHLTGLLLSAHVNDCLDKHPSTEKKAPKKEEDPKLIPLSSLPVPPHPLASPPPEEFKPNSSKSYNAFSFLMSRNKENEAWKEATEAEKSKWGKLKSNQKGKGKVKDEDMEEVIDEGGDASEAFLDTKPPMKKADTGAQGTTAGPARRPAPFYKVMQGMPIAVDAFRYGRIPGVTAYLLTHAHSDHYTNLSSSWKHGPVYCSETTANLVVHMLGVDRQWVHSLPMDVPTELPDTGGVKVTLIEANHCPGSCLFFFEGKQTVNAGDSTFHSAFVGTARIFRYLHCGDFRACPTHVEHPTIKGKKMDVIYLDTTYLDPKYCFPPQRMVIDACAELTSRIVGAGGDGDLWQPPADSTGSVKNWLGAGSTSKEKISETLEEPKKGAVLTVFGTYTIGKERIVKAAARALKTSIWCEPRKREFFKCQASLDPELQTMLGDDPLQCQVHVRPLSDINSETLLEYLEHWKGRWTKVVGFRPTGWTYTPPSGSDMANLHNIVQRDQSRNYNWSHLKQMRNSTPTVMLYGVPYSEHSSFFELTCFALSISYVRMIATVNVGSAKSRAKMNSWFDKWESERKRREKNEGEGKKDCWIVPRHQEYW